MKQWPSREFHKAVKSLNDTPAAKPSFVAAI